MDGARDTCGVERGEDVCDGAAEPVVECDVDDGVWCLDLLC